MIHCNFRLFLAGLLVLLFASPAAASTSPASLQEQIDTHEPASPDALTPDPLVQGMIDQVSSAALYGYVSGLSGETPVIVGGEPYTITTRYSKSVIPIEKATQYAYEHFQSLGLTTSYFEYNLPGTGVRRDVIAEQTGLTQPGRIVLAVAHLDSISDAINSLTLAPGADDNASGSAGVLAAADILSQYEFGCTLRYALFTGEEQGLYGSQEYADTVYNLGENVAGVLNLDMIAYNTTGTATTMELHTRPGDSGDLLLAGLFSDVIAAYQLDLTPLVVQDAESASDHYSFWQNGYPAILAIEDWSDHTPYYHKTTDRLQTLDMAYYTRMVKAAVGALAHLGCLPVPNPPAANIFLPVVIESKWNSY
jgi:hypothetical protein